MCPPLDDPTPNMHARPHFGPGVAAGEDCLAAGEDCLRKIVWMCWFQGEDRAPEIVRACIRSWRDLNPGWQVRCLDASTALHYAPALAEFDLTSRRVTAASLSDILRISLLHEYGGVWADATLYCRRPLDDWLPFVLGEGFFAFDRPGPDRWLSTWFLAAEPGSPVIAAWARAVHDYWDARTQAHHYFWVHRLFQSVCEADPTIGETWQAVPKISADEPHKILFSGLATPAGPSIDLDSDATPCFKLTHRCDADAAGPNSLLRRLIGSRRDQDEAPEPRASNNLARSPAFASLSVSTENLGDHVQILAADALLDRFGFFPGPRFDRDFELATAPGLDGERVVLMHGWFKRDSDEWPPHPALVPIFLGFHIRLFQSPSLLSEKSLAYFRAHQPIGCRDRHTAELLGAHDVETFVSHCLSLSLPRRLPSKAQTEIFVVSRDERLAAALSATLGPFTSILHYSGDTDFERNMQRARQLLQMYRDRARLLVTSLLHCALPALAMGIPVVMIFPINTPEGHASDRERFSSLSDIIPIWRFDQIGEIDWSAAPPDVGAIKLAIVDRLVEKLRALGLEAARSLGPIAEPSPVPI